MNSLFVTYFQFKFFIKKTDIYIGLHIAHKIKQVAYAIEHAKSFLNVERIIMSKVTRLKIILI